MSEPTIVWPSCKTEIKLTEPLVTQLIEQLEVLRQDGAPTHD